jgi:hypothetical protein
MKGRCLAVMALPLLLFTQIISRPPASSRPTEVGIGASGISFGGRSTLHQGLVMHLPLNELSGTRVNVAGTCGSDCNATAVNAPGAGGGAGSYGALFANASGQYLYSSAAALGGQHQSFTFSSWVRPSAFGTRVIASSDDMVLRDWTLLVGSGGVVSTVVFDSTAGFQATVSGDGTLVIGVPAHVVMTYTQTDKKARLFVNGAFVHATSALANGIANVKDRFTLGASAVAHAFDGTEDVGTYWQAVALDAAQVATLYNSGKGMDCAVIGASGLPRPTACWDLSEASGTRYASSVGTCTTDCNLSAVAAPGRTAGLVENGMGMAVTLNGTNQSLTIADNAALSSGGKSFSAAVWVLPTTVAGERFIMSKVGADPNREFALYASGDGLGAMASPTGNSANYVYVGLIPGALPINTWTLCYFQFDRVAQKVGIARADAVVTQSAATLADIANGAAAFVVGSASGSPSWAGSLDAASYWDRTLTLTERTALYAAGMGVPWPWTSLADGLLSKPLNWADRSDESKQRLVYAYTGVYVPSELLPFKTRKVYVR